MAETTQKAAGHMEEVNAAGTAEVAGYVAAMKERQ
jgi:hypothetical protein